jgi:hypothetical protein
MASNPSEDAELLKRVENLLEKHPAGQDNILLELQQELGALRKESDTGTLEKVFQTFGTAVGNQSRSSI